MRSGITRNGVGIMEAPEKKDAIKYANSIGSKEIAILDITNEDDAFCIGTLEKVDGTWVDSRKETYIY